MTAADAPPSPFDALAADYDATFSEGLLGGLYRRAVWARVDRAVEPGSRVLELGCGTGEDALHLAARGADVLAVDASGAMVEATERKAAGNEARGRRGRVRTRRLRAEDVGTLATDGPFDVVLSNFGVLNCVGDGEGAGGSGRGAGSAGAAEGSGAEARGGGSGTEARGGGSGAEARGGGSGLAVVADGLARCTRPGARLFLCVMGPLVPWEWAWYLLRGDPGRAFRRLRPGGARWRGVHIHYPGPAVVGTRFGDAFRPGRLGAVGALLPPPYAEAWARRHPGLIRRLDRWERRLEAVPPLPWLADHYLLEMVRR